MCSRTPQLCTHCCTVRGLGGGRCCCLRVMLESVRLLFIYQFGRGRICWRYTELRGVHVWRLSLCRCMCVCTMHVCPPPSMQDPPPLCPFMSSWHRERETEEWISDVGLFVFGALVLICGQNGKRSTSTAHAMWLKTSQYCCCCRVKTLYLQEKKKKTAASWMFLLFLNDD